MSGNGRNGKGGNGKPRRTPGRIPTFECDPEVRAIILREAKRGSSDREACLLAGIHPQTLSRWKREQGQAYRAFSAELKRARVRGKRSLRRRVRIASREDWKAAAWLLSRLYPEEFSEKRILEHRRTTKPMGQDLENDATREALDRLGAALEAESTEQEPGLHGRLPE